LAHLPAEIAKADEPVGALVDLPSLDVTRSQLEDRSVERDIALPRTRRL
jgi:hypothetical protein